MRELDCEESWTPKNWCFWTVVLEIFESPLYRNSSTLATSCEELTHWKRLWCWEGLGAGGKLDDRGWDGWMASPTRWTWVWVNSRSWWWTGRPGVLWFMASQRVGHDWATELNWFSSIDLMYYFSKSIVCFWNKGFSIRQSLRFLPALKFLPLRSWL